MNALYLSAWIDGHDPTRSVLRVGDPVVVRCVLTSQPREGCASDRIINETIEELWQPSTCVAVLCVGASVAPRSRDVGAVGSEIVFTLTPTQAGDMRVSVQILAANDLIAEATITARSVDAT